MPRQRSNKREGYRGSKGLEGARPQRGRVGETSEVSHGLTLRPTLRPAARKAAILDFVERSGKATVEQLAKKFDASLETVRRDLSAMADAGHVRKIHGGAVRLSSLKEGPFNERLAQNALAKQLIAEKLVKIISPGQSVFIDTGSTTLVCAETLTRVRELTVITNSVRIADIISSKGKNSKAILLGGSYRHDNAQTVGPATISEIENFRTDHVVLTVTAIDAGGIADFSEEEAHVARAMIKAADSVTIVADTSKLQRRSTFHVAELSEIDRLIVDKPPEQGLLDALDAAGIEVL